MRVFYFNTRENRNDYTLGLVFEEFPGLITRPSKPILQPITREPGWDLGLNYKVDELAILEHALKGVQQGNRDHGVQLNVAQVRYCTTDLPIIPAVFEKCAYKIVAALSILIRKQESSSPNSIPSQSEQTLKSPHPI